MAVTRGLVVEALSVDRGGRPVLRDLTFTLPPGAALMVTGSNGAGKSTLLRAIAGLIPRVGGTIELKLAPNAPLLPSGEKKNPSSSAGFELADLGEHAHYLGHANGLKLALTAADNLRFAAAWSGVAGLAPDDALAAVGLAHVKDFPVGLLSAGQRRRVALARLLVARRPLWLLDEPAAALDTVSEALLAALVRSHVEAGGLALAAVHGRFDVPARTLRLSA